MSIFMHSVHRMGCVWPRMTYPIAKISKQESMKNFRAQEGAWGRIGAGLQSEMDVAEMEVDMVSPIQESWGTASEAVGTALADKYSANSFPTNNLQCQNNQIPITNNVVKSLGRPVYSPLRRHHRQRRVSTKLYDPFSGISKKIPSSTRRTLRPRKAYLKLNLKDTAAFQGFQSQTAGQPPRRQALADIDNVFGEAIYPRSVGLSAADSKGFDPETDTEDTDAEDTDAEEDSSLEPSLVLSETGQKKLRSGPLSELSRDFLNALPDTGKSSNMIENPVIRLPLQNFRMVRLVGERESLSQFVTANNCQQCGYTLDAFMNMGGNNELAVANTQGTITEHYWCAQKSLKRAGIYVDQSGMAELLDQKGLFIYTVSPYKQ